MSVEDGKIKIDTQYYDETTKEIGIKLRATTLTGDIHIEKIFSVHDQPVIPGMPVRLIKNYNCESSGSGVGFELNQPMDFVQFPPWELLLKCND